jgi:hypothetical protein
MDCIKKYFTPALCGVIALSLSSCASLAAIHKGESAGLPVPNKIDTSLTTGINSTVSTPQQTHQETPVASQPLQTSDRQVTSTTPSLKTVTVTIYQADNQCESLVPEKVAVPADSPVDAVVGKVLKQADSGDFDLAGYRVKVNQKNGIATVDFRLSPNAKRKFSSLSSCEQFAIFGSLRKTLIDNAQLKIKNVRFTNQDAEISF